MLKEGTNYEIILGVPTSLLPLLQQELRALRLPCNPLGHVSPHHLSYICPYQMVHVPIYLPSSKCLFSGSHCYNILILDIRKSTISLKIIHCQLCFNMMRFN